MSAPLNPYIAGAPVTDQRMFFGRQDIFEWIERNLAGLYADHVLVLHGQRRVGKTSVLKQLPSRLPDRYIPVFFDLQGRAHTSLDRFLWWLAREIARVLRQDRGILIPLPEKEVFAADPEHLEAHFLPAVEARLGECNLLLTFDEFDTLEESGVRESLGRPLIDTLRRLMTRRSLNFIYSIGSSGRKLENMQAVYTEFFKAALYKKVSFLSAADAARLITRPVEGLLDYDPPTVERILQLARGHPYFTQLTCHELFSFCQRTGRRRVRIADVEQVLDDVIERGTVNLKFVWDEASDLEKWALAGLASLEPGSDLAALAAFLRRQRVRFTDLELEAALVHLRERDVLASDSRFIIELLRLWLKKNRAIEQVREELTEVHPIASRYVEIGLEYRDAGQFERAIASFGEALAVDPDYLPAQVGMAGAHLEQGAWQKAAEAFERALAIDADDVVARSGLCEAHLRLGDGALSGGRTQEARQAFHKILALNPEHGEARQRLADLAQGQAEAALRAGEIEPALELLREALTHTPDDPDLEARLASALATHRRGRLQRLSTRAQAAASAERWSDALAAWQEYLDLEPEDLRAAQAEMARLQDEAARARTYAAAQTALGQRDYDEAIRLLKAIVLEDEAYKDAARLMTQAIEDRRRSRPRWKWKGIRLSRGARLGLTAGLAIAVLGSTVFFAWDRLAGAAIRAAGTAGPPAATSSVKVCLLTEADGIAGVYYAPIWSAIEAAQTTYGIEGSYVEGADGSNVAERIEAFLGEGCDLVVSHGNFAQAMLTAATQNPEASFLILDASLEADLPNILGLEFKTWEAAFLAGYLAAGMSQTGRVGTFGGMDIPGVVLSMDGFSRGVEHYNQVHSSEVVVLGRNPTLRTGLFIDTFEDAALARQASDALLDQGADILFPITGLLTTASADAAQGRERAYVIGADIDWAETHPEYADVILSSAEKGFAELVTEAIRRLVEGEFPGEQLTGNLENGGVLLSPFHTLDSDVPTELAAELEALQQALPAQSDPNRTRHAFRFDTIRAIAHIHPDPDSLYLGTEHAGIYRSDDGGQTWQPARSGLGGGAITSLAVHEADPNLLFASVGLAGVYRSTDGGLSWQPVNQGLGLDRLLGWGSTVVLDPYRYPVLWFADAGSVYQSTDLGETWIEHEPQGFLFTNLAADPSEMDTLFATSAHEATGQGPGVYHSRDGGRTWTKLLEMEAEFINPGQFAVERFEGLRLYVSADSEALGTYASSDGGETWRQVLGHRCDHLAADPNEPAAAYCAHGGEVWRTGDGGESWQALPNVTPSSAPLSTFGVRAGGAAYYAGTSDGFFISTGAGLTRSSGLPLAPVDLTMVRGSGPRLYGLSGSCPGVRSGVNAFDWEDVPAPECTSWAIHPDGQTAYATDGQRVWRSSDGLASWEERSAPSSSAGRLTVHPIAGDYVFSSLAGRGDSLYLSTDGARSWRPAAGIESLDDPVLAFDHGDGSRVYGYSLRSVELYRSDGHGFSWRPCRYPTSAISHVLVDPQDRDRLLVATLGSGVLLSTDGCQSWMESNRGLETLFVNALAFSPSDPYTFYAATDLGAYVSEDGGASWTPLSGWSETDSVVYALAFDPLNPGVLYASTSEGVVRWELSPTPVARSAAGLRPPPTATAMGMPARMATFAEPILEAVSSRSPLVNYDFSTSFPPADALVGNPTIAGGVLQCQVYSLACGLTWEGSTPDFVAEYEFTYMTPGNLAPVTLKFRASDFESLEFSMRLQTSPASGAEWTLREDARPTATNPEVGRGVSEAVALGRRAWVTVIAHGPRIAVLLNGETLVVYTESSVRGHGFELRLGAGQQIAEVHIDNVRLWDIAGLGLP